MTEAQEEDLMIEWSLYSPHQKKLIVAEYEWLNKEKYTKKGFLAFLRGKLEIDRYWKGIGLA